jgi:hypothetical protein
VSTLPSIITDVPVAPYVTPVRNISWPTTTLPNGTTIQGGIITADAVLEERSDDESIITENPVETGSVTNDHAFDLPQDLELTYVWSAASPQNNGQYSFLNTMYQQFLTLKQAKILLAVVTGKRPYQNMLIKGISQTTNKDSENILMLRITLKQLLLAVTSSVTISSASQQSIPAKTMPTINGGAVSLGPATNFNSGNPGG